MERIIRKSSESVGKGSGIVGKARGKKRGEGWVGESKKERGRGGWGKDKKSGRGGWVGDDVIEKIKNEKMKKMKK